MRRLSLVGLISALAAAGACSLVNAPEDVRAGPTSTGGGMCITDDDCPPSRVPCASYACVLGGACQLVMFQNGTACDDGHFCTVDDVCDEGQCHGKARFCPGGDACNLGTCNEEAKACTTVTVPTGTPCDDGDPCTDDGVCQGGLCQKGPDACQRLATDCTDPICEPGVGCTTQNKLDGTFCGQSACSNGQCSAGHCEIVPLNEGESCDDGLYCTVDDACVKGHCLGAPRTCGTAGECSRSTCDETEHQCVVTPIRDKELCDDGDACTAGEFCNDQHCGGGLPPSTYFAETFGTGGPGWTKGPEWQIGKAKASTGGKNGDDPAVDHSGEGVLAGVAIGGLAHVDPNSPIHALHYLTSPSFDANFAGTLYLTFYRWLNTDYQPYMRDTIEVSADDGATWSIVWENPWDIPINDAAWTFQAVDITAWKGPKTRVRWGFGINNAGVYDEASWNIDAVKVQNAPCPL
ncbi:Flagellar hook-length control protein FliK [Minicystis rosea]|nr:Flagellar hook-length control protein FliK [Minicystis rosea]